jgi:lipopolysaccharide heptosyltransferase I
MSTRSPLDKLDAQRIALIKPSALGDILHSLPVLTALRRRYPHAHITWVVNHGYEPLLRGHRDLDDVVTFDRRGWRRGWISGTRTLVGFLRELRRRRFDVVIDLQGLLRSGLITRATGARRRVGLSTAREGAGWFYTDIVPVPEPRSIHAVDRYWVVAQAFGVGEGAKEFHVPIPEEAHRWAAEVLRDWPRPWLMLGVGSRWMTKRWLPEHFATLTRWAQAQFGGTALFVGGPDETVLAQTVCSGLTGPTRDWTGRTTLPQLAALLARADVMLANDTGPLHLAVALGRPVVAPYTCTRVHLTGPYGAAHRAVETTVWCRGSCLKRCARMECMAELTPNRLWPILYEVLHAWQSRNQSA